MNFKHLLVDGWNIVHSDSELKRAFERSSQEAVRAMLLERLAPIHDFGGARLTIVYDGRGEEISIVRPYRSLTLSEVFTPSSMTADELIEGLCATSKNPDSLAVATRDGLIRLTASSFGVFTISPEELFELACKSGRELKLAVEKNSLASRRRWRESSPFDVLDMLALDLGKVMQSPFARRKSKNSESGKKEPAKLAAGNLCGDKKGGGDNSKIARKKSGTVSKSKTKFKKTIKNLSGLSRDFLRG